MIPVVITAYNRLDTLKKTLNSLFGCDKIDGRKIIVYSDGWKGNKSEVWAVREFLVDGMILHDLSVFPQKKNLGLRGNSLFAISESLKEYDKIIFIQDDMQFSKDFLTFMDAALNKFEDRDDIMFVSGYSHISYGACYLSPLIADGLGIWKSKYTPYHTNYPDTTFNWKLKRFAEYTTPMFASYLKNIIEGKSDAFMMLLAYQMYLREARCMHPNVNKVRYLTSDSTNCKAKTNKKLNNSLYVGFSGLMDETEIPYEMIKKTKAYKWNIIKRVTRWLTSVIK